MDLHPPRRPPLQAVGTDAAGRRQYLYHPVFRAQQEEAKHDHVLEVAEALPKVREAVEAGLGDGTGGLTRERVLATAVRLLDLGFFRIGSERYADLHQTYGLTTSAAASTPAATPTRS